MLAGYNLKMPFPNMPFPILLECKSREVNNTTIPRTTSDHFGTSEEEHRFTFR